MIEDKNILLPEKENKNDSIITNDAFINYLSDYYIFPNDFNESIAGLNSLVFKYSFLSRNDYLKNYFLVRKSKSINKILEASKKFVDLNDDKNFLRLNENFEKINLNKKIEIEKLIKKQKEIVNKNSSKIKKFFKDKKLNLNFALEKIKKRYDFKIINTNNFVQKSSKPRKKKALMKKLNINTLIENLYSENNYLNKIFDLKELKNTELNSIVNQRKENRIFKENIETSSNDEKVFSNFFKGIFDI